MSGKPDAMLVVQLAAAGIRPARAKATVNELLGQLDELTDDVYACTPAAVVLTAHGAELHGPAGVVKRYRLPG